MTSKPKATWQARWSYSIVTFVLGVGAGMLIQRGAGPQLPKADRMSVTSPAPSSTSSPTTQVTVRTQVAAHSNLSTTDQQLLEAGGRDIKEALAFIESNYAEPIRDRARSFLLSELAKTDLNTIGIILPLIRDQRERNTAVSLVANNWAKQDYARLIEYSKQKLEPTTTNAIYRQLVGTLAQAKQFQLAAELIENMPASAAKISAVRDLGFNFGIRDGIAAGTWALGLQDAEAREAAIDSTISGIVGSGNLTALQQVRDSAPPELHSRFDQEIGRLAGAKGVAALQDLGTGATPDAVLAGAVSGMPAAEIPALTPKLVRITNAQTRSMAIAQAGSRMFELGPEKSLAWLQSCPEEVKAPAIAGLFSRWYDNDRQTLKTWLDSAGPGRDQDLAREVVVGKLLNSDLVEAQNIAATIGDSATRDRVMKSVTRRVKAALPKN